MNKPLFITLTTLTLIVACLVGLAMHTYDNRKVTVAASPNYQAELKTAQASNKTLSTTNGTLQAQVTQLTSQKAQFCAELSKAKVTDTLCN